MLNRKYCLSIFLCASPLYSQTFHADQEINVTAARYPLTQDKSPGTVEIVDKEDIENKNGQNLAHTLDEIPGLHVLSNGGPGQQTNIFLRGFNSEHVLILLDGIPLNDPSSPGRSFDFSSLNSDSIERIEVLKGPQSGLYGSEAMGGVVNIITKKGKGDIRTELLTQVYSLGGGKGELSSSGATKDYNYAITVSKEHFGGISSAGKQYGNTEIDRSTNESVLTKLGWSPLSWSELSLTFRAANQLSDVDKMGGPGGDDINAIVRNKTLALKLTDTSYFLNEDLEIEASFDHSQYQRVYKNDPDYIGDIFVADQTYWGSSGQEQVLARFHINKHITTLGSSYYTESMKEFDRLTPSASFDRKTSKIFSVFAQEELQFEKMFLSLAGRLDKHEHVGDFTTYRVAPGIHLQEDLALKASYGTGAKAPSLFQLYSAYGSTDLKVENSKGGDLSLIKHFGADSYSISYFYNELRNRIDYSFTQNKYENAGRARIKGFELETKMTLASHLDLQMGLTLQEAKDADGSKLLRQPETMGSLAVNYKPLRILKIRPSYRYVGERADIGTKLSSYSLVDLALTYECMKHLELFANVYNIFDAHYEEIAGYGTPGTWGLLGAKWII